MIRVNAGINNRNADTSSVINGRTAETSRQTRAGRGGQMTLLLHFAVGQKIIQINPVCQTVDS